MMTIIVYLLLSIGFTAGAFLFAHFYLEHRRERKWFESRAIGEVKHVQE